MARLIESSLREVDAGMIEAAQSMGATPMQIICKVMIPESVPSLVQNVTIALTTILGYSAMSGIIGGGGLGKIAINYGYYRYKYFILGRKEERRWRRCLKHKNTQKGDERRNAAIAQRRKKTGAKDIKARQQKGKREQPERVLCQRKQAIIEAHKDVRR